MRGILLSIALAAGLTACAPDWLRQYTTTVVDIDHMKIAVSWLRIEEGRYDLHVSRAHPPAGTVEPAKLPGAVARQAAVLVMADRCRGAELYGDTALPQPTFTFRAVCAR